MIVQCSSCTARNRLPASRMTDKAKCASCKSPLLPLSRPIAVRDSEDFDELVRTAPLPVLVDFWAPWCGPCRTIGPELAKVADGRAGSLIVAKVDTDELPRVAKRFDVRGIPTMILFRQGKEAKRISGAMSADAIVSNLALPSAR